MELRGRTVLVTGAATPLGQAIARRLRVEACELVLAGQPGDDLDGLAGELEARVAVGDGARLVEAAGDVDILVTGAGGTGAKDHNSLEDIDRVIDGGLKAPIVLARLFGERMVARGYGHIVFVSSLAAKTASADSSLLNATMFGVRGFALALRQDWAPLGVGVSCVNPGPIGTAPSADGAARPAGFRPKLPRDVAAAVVRAVRHDRAEVDVADPVRRAGVVFGQLAPQAAARLQRLTAEDR
jgi:short-subunit dehydrogenase